MSEKKSVGFIGLGLMGHGMAKNLVEKGFPTTVLDINPAPVQDLVRRGAKAGANPRAIAASSDIVILSLTTAEIVENVVLGNDGVLAGLRPGSILIDTSTCAPATTAKVAAAVMAKGCRYADAPLTRTPKEAEEGRLNTMVGADPETFELIKPVLAAFAENIIHIGPVGSGHKLKLINNFILLTTATVLAEAVSTAKKAGVDPQKILDVCSLGAANGAMLQICMPYVLAGDESRMQFSIANAAKDVRYYAGLAASVGAPTAVANLSQQYYADALKAGRGDQFVPHMFDHIAK